MSTLIYFVLNFVNLWYLLVEIVNFSSILHQKFGFFLLIFHAKVFGDTLYIYFGHIPSLNLVGMFLIFFCILYFVKHWCLTSSTKDLFCLLLYFSKADLSCDHLIQFGYSVTADTIIFSRVVPERKMVYYALEVENIVFVCEFGFEFALSFPNIY